MAYVGKMKCPLCGSLAVVTHSKSGVRNLKCAPPCGFSAFVQPTNTKGVRAFDAATMKDSDEEGAPPAPPAPPAAGKRAGLLIGG